MSIGTTTSTEVLEPASDVDDQLEAVASVSRFSDGAPSSQRRIVSSVAAMLAAVTLVALLNLAVVGRVQHSAAQQRLFDRFRSQLASGTAPVGGFDVDGRPVSDGSPVAYLKMPSIGVKQVVVEGTRPSTLANGPGHRRDTVLPGQFGTSVLFGRRAMFGGPFADIGQLREGDKITVTTAQGEFTFGVLGVRREGDAIPPPLSARGARITLVTADGAAFFPTGVLRVDADLIGDAVGGGPRQVTANALPAEEAAMSGDSSTLWELVLWLQALIVACIGLAWAWKRWGRIHAWVVFTPLLLLLSLMVWGQITRLFPNIA